MNTEPTTGRDLVPGFAAMVTAARESAGLSQAALARKAGVGTNTVSAIEREIRAPSLRIASKLAEALGIRSYLHDPANPLPAKRAK